MKKQKFMLAVLLIAILVSFVVSFSVAQEKKPYIPLVSKGFQHQFWLAVKAGAEQAAKDSDVTITFEGPESEAMVDKQMDMLQVAIDKNPDAICFAAVDSKAAIPLLEQAQAKGIPIIGFDSGVDSDIPLTTAATDILLPLL
jgi:ribose transport system substrate-binding protein